METCDVAIIGAGMAGASLAGELSADVEVVLLEAESQPGYHSTGRSAALSILNYGAPATRPLSRRSRSFLSTPPDDFCEAPLLAPRGVLSISSEEQLPALEKLFAEDPTLRRLSAAEAAARVPILERRALAAAAYDDDPMDIDVGALHQGYLRMLKRRGGRLRCSAPVTALTREGGAWRLETAASALAAPIVVNAAGAWADEVVAQAGLRPLGLVPRRRTAIIVAVPGGHDPGRWPAVVDAEETYYFKPEAGKLMVSPADATPTAPADAQPEELDVAITVDRFERATGSRVARVEHRWAGLRTFAPDETPVTGFDPRTEGFFWLAGQGGTGIQTAPAAAQLAAALILGRPLPGALAAEGVQPAAFAPERLLDGG